MICIDRKQALRYSIRARTAQRKSSFIAFKTSEKESGYSMNRKFSILRTDPGQTVADKASLALELFTEFGETPFQDETTTTTEPPRSSKTTTVARRTGLTTRAIALTTLATENLAFFRDKDFVAQEGLQQAERALENLYGFLQRNQSDFTKAVSRDMAFLERERGSAREELAFLRKDFQKTRDPETRAAIEGRINLTNFQIRRLQTLSANSDRALSFFAQLRSSPRSGKRKGSPVSRTRKERR